MGWTRLLPATLLLGAIALASPAQQSQPAQPDIQRLITELGDRDSAVREAATHALSEMAEQALPALEAAEQSRHPEVASRARLLLQRIRLGIPPDAPGELVQLVLQARAPEASPERSLARQRLASLPGNLAARPLARLIPDVLAEANATSLLELWPRDRWTLACLADELASSGQQQTLLAWLEQSAAANASPRAAPHFAFAVAQAGELEPALERWRERAATTNTPEDRRVLACLLFAAGDAEALEVARSLPSPGPLLPITWSLLDGDAESALREAQGQSDELARLTLSLIVARATDDASEPQAEAALRDWLKQNARSLRDTVRAENTGSHRALARRAIVAATFAGDLQAAFMLADEIDAAGLVRVMYRRLDFDGAEDVGARHARREDEQRREVQLMQRRMMDELRRQTQGERFDVQLSSFARRRVEAEDALAAGRASEAAGALEALNALDEVDPGLRWSLGFALESAGDAARGAEKMERARFMGLADSVVRSGVAEEMWLRGRRDDALEEHALAARWATLVEGDALPALDGYARRLSQEGRFGESAQALAAGMAMLTSETLYEELADQDRGLYYAFYLAAELERSRMNRFAAAGEWDKAQAALERSLAYLPQSETGIDLVNALDAAGQKERADRLFIDVFTPAAVAAARYRQSSLLNNQAAWLAVSCNRRLDTALNLAQTAVACDLSSPSALDTLAEVYLRLGQPERARELLDRVLALAEARDANNAAPFGMFNDYLLRRQDLLRRIEEAR